ncbi:chorismate pyruvate-lyase family protein [Streptosporangium lutulentum]|uniref:Chorismate-pyruvate lyase n=1 Tax=Streptosporangium lutulentum TaxID=1461250 RepID=A0ABT9QWY1_9ACTN|nr:chorismate pyruvate-lyase family protein [Streptosporangium lutulentum]MDP9850464.1 chorismate-pyruvate lyase [Streptosporangium lutulentum]
MVLEQDGSTTRILSALVGVRLQLRTLTQDLAPSAQALPQKTRVALSLSAHQKVVVRTSELRTPVGLVVSRNRVIMVGSHPMIGEIIARPDHPLGLVLRAHQVEQHRQLLDAGIRAVSWEADEKAVISMWRSYFISIDGKPVLWIEEMFCPRFVPVLEAFPRSLSPSPLPAVAKTTASAVLAGQTA